MTATRCPTPRSSPRSAAATRRRSPTCTRARPCSTSARAAASTSCSPPAGSGPTGKAYGLDMTDEMLDLARAQPARGRGRERRVRQGHDRGRAAPRRLDRRDHLQLRDQPLRRQAARLPRGRPGAAPRRSLRRQRRGRRPGHGRGDSPGHAAVDGLHRRGADPRGLRARADRRRVRGGRDPRDPPRPRPGCVGDRPRAARRADARPRSSSTTRRPSTGAGRTRSGTRSRSTSIAIASSGRRWPTRTGLWSTGSLASLMVAEERITTKFSGLVGAHGSEEEATFLATQQVDEARHMQFYARFQDEVVAEPATVAAHVERARREVTPAFRRDLRRGPGRGPRATRRRARRISRPRSASSRSTT